jgi:hypothetical protein
MGFSISWIACPIGKGETLRRAGLRDTGIADPANEAAYSVARLPNGWTVIVSNDFEYGTAERIAALSKGTHIVSCQVDEHAMVSAAHCATDAKPIWSVSHDGQDSVLDVQTSGEPPENLNDIIARMRDEQTKNGGAESGVDYGFEVPVEIAFAQVEYRHDRWQFPWGEPAFTIAEPADSGDEVVWHPSPPGNRERIIVGLCLVVLVAAYANIYAGWHLFGGYDKGVTAVIMIAGLIYFQRTRGRIRKREIDDD